jgi:hypothetical protein
MKHTTEVTLEVIPLPGVVCYKEIMFEVTFEVSGRYRPSTLTEPEEHSELNIDIIRIGSIDGKRLHGTRLDYRESLALSFRNDSERWFELTPEEFDVVIQEHCWDAAIDLKQDSDYFDNLKEGWD